MDAATNYGASSPPETTEEIITTFVMDIQCISEKLANLNSLSMCVEIKENDLEAFVSDTDSDLVIKTLEYALLSGFLDSEVNLLEAYISHLQMEKDNVIKSLFSRIHGGETLSGMVDMLHDSEKALELLLADVLEIKTRSANFEKNLIRLCGCEDYTESLNSIDQAELNEKMKMNMHTLESHRDVLRKLDKSLEREINLENRVSELTQMEETLTTRLRLSEQEVVYAKEEAETTFEKFYETDHTRELLTETCKVLISKINMLQFNLKGSIQRESQLKRDLLKLEERSTDESAYTEGILELISTIEDLRAQVMEAEYKRKELKDANEKVVSLEAELSDVKVKLQHAETCYKDIGEEKNVLLSTILGMDNVIEDLKNKVTQGKVQTKSMEDRYIFLSKSKSSLKKELKIVKGKVKSLEKSLHQMEETKNAFADNVNHCSNVILNLVKQTTLERERLRNQISYLKQDNKILLNHSKKTDEDPDVEDRYDDKASSNDDFTTDNKEALSTNFEVENVTDSTETARGIDARQLKTKDVLLVLFILVIPLLGVLVYQTRVKHIM
ncbi:WPP domain-interacting tail-anchored protein 1 [Helianthus annuus]|uniref:WPP domain-interacting tail-anchored protein 1 n=1 Tax=Helianthus annuus TaxID=4232 RepID=UPI000B908E6C|nr:WPP domain-interacting tail-anchored protein 1 [Helianthus annuus]